jgi:hypothetical protein
MKNMNPFNKNLSPEDSPKYTLFEKKSSCDPGHVFCTHKAVKDMV